MRVGGGGAVAEEAPPAGGSGAEGDRPGFAQLQGVNLCASRAFESRECLECMMLYSTVLHSYYLCCSERGSSHQSQLVSPTPMLSICGTILQSCTVLSNSCNAPALQLGNAQVI